MQQQQQQSSALASSSTNKRRNRAVACCSCIITCILLVYNHASSTRNHHPLLYVASSLEQEWNQSIKLMMQSWPRLGCPKMMLDEGNGRTGSEKSYFVSSSSGKKHQIEPLIGTLRHPETACKVQSAEVNRKKLQDWIIVFDAKKPAVLFVDDDEDRRWVQNLYPEGFFDSVMNTSSLFSGPNYWHHYYKVAYVNFRDVVWMMPFFFNLDEVFLDHRTYGNPLLKVWAADGHNSIAHEDITSSYSLLSSLRHKGVRAHAA